MIVQQQVQPVPVAQVVAQPMTTLTLVIPQGMGPGQTFQFIAPSDGKRYNATVPQGLCGGMQMSVQVPAREVVPTVQVATVVVAKTKTACNARCRGCGKPFQRKEKDRGGAAYYRCERCQGGFFPRIDFWN